MDGTPLAERSSRYIISVKNKQARPDARRVGIRSFALAIDLSRLMGGPAGMPTAGGDEVLWLLIATLPIGSDGSPASQDEYRMKAKDLAGRDRSKIPGPQGASRSEAEGAPSSC